MPNNKTVDNVIAEAERLALVWSENNSFAMGEITLAKLRIEIDKLRNLKQSRDEMRIQLSKLVDDTKDQLKLVDSINTRGRSGMKAVFGPDSAQYAQVGGTRKSERKARTAKKSKPSSS
jgi:hypothetical protein